MPPINDDGDLDILPPSITNGAEVTGPALECAHNRTGAKQCNGPIGLTRVRARHLLESRKFGTTRSRRRSSSTGGAAPHTLTTGHTHGYVLIARSSMPLVSEEREWRRARQPHAHHCCATAPGQFNTNAPYHTGCVRYIKKHTDGEERMSTEDFMKCHLQPLIDKIDKIDSSPPIEPASLRRSDTKGLAIPTGHPSGNPLMPTELSCAGRTLPAFAVPDPVLSTRVAVTDRKTIAQGAISRQRDCHSAASPPPPSVGFSIGIERGCQQNDSLADG